MLDDHRNFMRSLVFSSAFVNLFTPLCFASELFVVNRHCTRMSNDFIDGDETREFAMEGGISMSFRIFCLLNPGDVELTPDGE